MAFCPKCGKPINEDAKFCEGCGNEITLNSASAPVTQNDSASIAEILIAVFCPIAGDALYRKRKKDNPKAAKTIIRAATGGLLFWGLICTIFVLLFSGCGKKNLKDISECSSPASTPQRFSHDSISLDSVKRKGDEIYVSGTVTNNTSKNKQIYVYIECFNKNGKKVAGQGEYCVGTVSANKDKDFSCTFTVTEDASKIVYYNVGTYCSENGRKLSWGSWTVE